MSASRHVASAEPDQSRNEDGAQRACRHNPMPLDTAAAAYTTQRACIGRFGRRTTAPTIPAKARYQSTKAPSVNMRGRFITRMPNAVVQGPPQREARREPTSGPKAAGWRSPGTLGWAGTYKTYGSVYAKGMKPARQREARGSQQNNATRAWDAASP